MLTIVLLMLLVPGVVLLIAGLIKWKFFDSSSKTKKSKPDSGEEEFDDLINSRKAKKERRRMNIRYAQDAPFFFISDHGVWTGLILESSQDEFMTFAEEAELVQRLADVYQGVLGFVRQFPKDFPNGVRCHEVTRYQPVNVSRWRAQYDDAMWDPSRLFNSLIDSGVSPHIAECTPERKRMLMVRLGELDKKKPTAMNPLDSLLAVEGGVVDEYFERSDLDFFRQRARQFFARMSNYGAMPMDRADLSWLVRKTMSGHFQPEEEPVTSTRPWRNTYFDHWADVSGDNLSDCVRIAEPSPEGSKPRHSYVTTLIVDDAETFVPFEQTNAWGKILRSLPYPAEVSWRFFLMTEKAWGKLAEKRIRNLRDERQDRNKAAGQPANAPTGAASFDDKMASADELAKELEISPRPVMIGQLRITVSAPSREELNDAAREVINALSGSVKLKRERGVQFALLEEQIPGDVNTARIGKSAITQYAGGLIGGERYTDVEMIAMARLDSSPTVGDGVEYDPGHGITRGWMGHALGYSTENGALFHFDPHVQIARNKGAGVAVIGASGGGKSTLSLMLFFWMSESGVQIVVIDPKDDFRAFVYYIAFGSQVNDPEFDNVLRVKRPGDRDFPYTVINSDFWNQTEIVDLWRGINGMLDPWVLSKGDFNTGASLAREILELILPSEGQLKIADRAMRAMKSDHARALEKGEQFGLGLGRLKEYVSEQVEKYRYISDREEDERGERPSYTDKMNADVYIREHTDVMETLERVATEDYANLLFGDGSVEDDAGGTQLQDISKRRTIITVKGLQFEDKPIEKWGSKQRNAAAALYTALHRIRDFFLAGDRKVKPTRPGTPPVRPPRALIIDEGYVITAIPAGKDLVGQALRQGRSYNFVVIFISQQAKDIAELQSGDQDDPSTNQFPTVFVFRQAGDDEARSALKLLRVSGGGDGSDETNTLAMQLTESGGALATGMCVVKDCDNRVGVIVTDPMYNELWAATQTNPQARGVYQQEQITSDGREWTIDDSKRNEVRTGVVRGVLEDARGEAESAFEMDDWEEAMGISA